MTKFLPDVLIRHNFFIYHQYTNMIILTETFSSHFFLGGFEKKKVFFFRIPLLFIAFKEKKKKNES